MKRPILEFHPEAAEEARVAYEWYASQSEKAAEKFKAEFHRAIEQILEAPNQWPAYLHGTRQYLFDRFPYLLVFRGTEEELQIVAVAHGKRKPGYWKSRLPK